MDGPTPARVVRISETYIDVRLYSSTSAFWIFFRTLSMISCVISIIISGDGTDEVFLEAYSPFTPNTEVGETDESAERQTTDGARGNAPVSALAARARATGWPRVASRVCLSASSGHAHATVRRLTVTGSVFSHLSLRHAAGPGGAKRQTRRPAANSPGRPALVCRMSRGCETSYSSLSYSRPARRDCHLSPRLAPLSARSLTLSMVEIMPRLRLPVAARRACRRCDSQCL